MNEGYDSHNGDMPRSTKVASMGLPQNRLRAAEACMTTAHSQSLVFSV
jgi:hypothetical protein